MAWSSSISQQPGERGYDALQVESGSWKLLPSTPSMLARVTSRRCGNDARASRRLRFWTCTLLLSWRMAITTASLVLRLRAPDLLHEWQRGSLPASTMTFWLSLELHCTASGERCRDSRRAPGVHRIFIEVRGGAMTRLSSRPALRWNAQMRAAVFVGVHLIIQPHQQHVAAGDDAVSSCRRPIVRPAVPRAGTTFQIAPGLHIEAVQ